MGDGAGFVSTPGSEMRHQQGREEGARASCLSTPGPEMRDVTSREEGARFVSREHPVLVLALSCGSGHVSVSPKRYVIVCECCRRGCFSVQYILGGRGQRVFLLIAVCLSKVFSRLKRAYTA